MHSNAKRGMAERDTITICFLCRNVTPVRLCIVRIRDFSSRFDCVFTMSGANSRYTWTTGNLTRSEATFHINEAVVETVVGICLYLLVCGCTQVAISVESICRYKHLQASTSEFQRSAKPLFIGSIPIDASNLFNINSLA